MDLLRIAADHGGMSTTPTNRNDLSPRRLERPSDERVLAGVAGALANRTQVSVGVIRIAFLVAALFGGFGILAYVVGWVLIPAAGAAQSPATRWWADLRHPDRRARAALIGLAILILLLPLLPLGLLAAAALLLAGLLMTRTTPNENEADTAPR